MIPTKPRRLKMPKIPKHFERLYKQTKCRDCTVVVTRMDFAKILGKFSKVKIQYESNSTAKSRPIIGTSPNSKLKNNENGMVRIQRTVYNPHPAKKLLGTARKSKNAETPSPRQATNVLKENNRLKKPVEIVPESKGKKLDSSKLKHYGIVFVSPTCKKKDVRSDISLDNLLPSINNNLLPSEDWCIDYFPKNGEPKDDKIYDRIAAELEDLMYNEKTKIINSDNKGSKNDEFPSILDILNDNSKVGVEKNNDQNIPMNLESSDVEAMLLGKSKPIESMPMDIDHPEVSNLATEKNQLSNNEVTNHPKENSNTLEASTLDDNPHSPSILDEAQKEIPVLSVAEKPASSIPADDFTTPQSMQIDENDNTNTKNKNNGKTGITQVIFKKTINGTSSKTVICPKNLKYSISIQGKAVELLGAPKVISSLEDLQVLLQIVEDSELTSLYVLHS